MSANEPRGGTCPECGALHSAGLSCWEQLGALLAWEYEDAELRAEHFLTVACYNLQHPAQFTEEALASLRAALTDYLDNGVDVSTLRRRAAAAFEGKRRVLRREAERQYALRPWPMTISDVYLPGRPEGAAWRVRRWAETFQVGYRGGVPHET